MLQFPTACNLLAEEILSLLVAGYSLVTLLLEKKYYCTTFSYAETTPQIQANSMHEKGSFSNETQQRSGWFLSRVL
jgi:hypothetical protein